MHRRCRNLVRARCVSSCAIALMAILTGSTLSAAGPSLEKVTPGVGQRGTSFELQLEGSGFSEGAGILFYRSGLDCTNLKVDSESKIVATFQASAECPLGNHPFRVRGNQGLSELRVVRVMPLPLVKEVEPNNSSNEAQAIAAGSTVTGVLGSGDVDHFKLTLKKGERLSAEIEAVRLASHLTDIKLQVFGPDHRPIASADDTPLGRQDPYLTLIADGDGDYVVQIKNSGSEGNDDSRYALHLGHFPRPDFVYPPGGPVGQEITVKVSGDPTAQWDATVSFEQAGVQGFYPEQAGLKPPTPIPFRVAPFGNVLESEPNNQTSDVSMSANRLPIAFNGVISEPGDQDLFRFQAEAGSSIEFTVFASQLGSQADTVIRLLSKNGTVITSGDDGNGLDSKLVWNCPTSDDYLLQVVEKRRAGGNRYFYRVEVQTVDPSVVAFLPRRDRRNQNGQSVTVPQGNRVLGLVAVRRQRWTGDAEIDFPKLPAGMVVEHARIIDGEYLMPVVFEAAKDAPIGAELVPVLARSYNQSPTILGEFEQPVDLVAASADRLYQGVTVNRLAVAVVEPNPYRIRLEQPPTSLPRDGSLELIVHVDRDSEFESALEISIPFLPTWVEAPDKITVPADQTTGRVTLRAHPDVASGVWPTVAEGKPATPTRPRTEEGAATTAATAPAVTTAPRPPRGGRRKLAKGGLEVASQLLSLEIADSPLSGQIGQLQSTPGQSISVTVPLKRTGEVPAKLTASLNGLPSRVQADAVTITGDDKQAVFSVKLSEDAPIGQFDGLACELVGEWNGHKVTYTVGRGGSLKIVGPGELIVDESGRPLSQLEILRNQPASDDESTNEDESK